MFDMNQGGGNENDILKSLMEQLKQEDSVMRVQMNDQRLMKLAEYDATQGYMKMQVTPEDLQGRFHELKGLVKKGSYTLKTLEDDVYKRWGIDEDPRNSVLGKEAEAGVQSSPIIGFGIEDMDVAELPEDSPENT